MRTVVKICGITRVEDGLAALRAGADWLGVIRHPASPRWRPLDEAAAMIRAIAARQCRPFQVVGVYVNAERERIEHEADALGLDRIQLHADETLAFARALGRPVLKVLPIEGAESIARADDFPDLDLLTDTHDPIRFGGTGQGYDYRLLGALIRRRRVVVAGGLNPENVGAVVRELRPFGVDVSSGVESAPGLKDPARIEAFIHAVRAAET